MSLREESSYWVCCDGEDQLGVRSEPCHTRVGPARDINSLYERAISYGWRLISADARCPRHQIEVK